jgi:AcrR family transcriptional regulator
MPRPAVHDPDDVLDSARAVVLDTGSTSATVAAIARASGAPVGSLYHRFGSRDDLMARMWIRAVRRSQARWLAALERGDPLEAATAAGLSVYDFAREHRHDARLLVSIRREDLIQRELGASVAEELAALNRPIERGLLRLTRSLYGSVSREAVERTALATFDLPYGAMRRRLIADESLPRHLRPSLETAIRAVLAERSR